MRRKRGFARLLAASSAALATGLATGAAGPAHAHPHVWIDVAVRVAFDEQGRVDALHQTWRFDPLYSGFAVAGLETEDDGRPADDALEAMLAQTLDRLAAFGYFTHLQAGLRTLKVEPPRDAEARMAGTRLVFAFELPLAQPVEPDDGFAYSVYDPSFYTEILHREGLRSVALDSAPTGCSASLQAPDPDESAVRLAALLDVGETPERDLGAAFAERVSVRCD
jgi:ABC-type uncharacterized transport system substrate-binding protein